jgi:hypothetical protein
MTSLRDEAHPKFLLRWPVWGTVQGIAIGVLFSAIQLDWYPLAQGTVIFMSVCALAKVCELALLAQSWWRRMLAVFLIFGVTGLIMVESIRALQRRSVSRQVARVDEPEKPVHAPAPDKPAPENAPPLSPEPSARAPVPDRRIESQSSPQRKHKPTPPITAPIVVAPSGEAMLCEMIPPDRPPNVTLQPGDIVFAAEGGLLRLDAEMKPQRIVISDELAAIRGIAVESSGTILVSTHACGGGAIVRVDPKTGRQTLVASGFKTTKAILIEPSGTLLVADEVGGSPIWGYLWRLNLKTGDKSEIYRFAPSEVAPGMGVDPASGDIFFTRRGLFRLSSDGVRRMDVEGVLTPTSMTMAGENVIVVGEGPPAIEMRTNGEVIGRMASGGPISHLAARDKQVFVGYANGRIGRIRQTDREAENVWEGKPSNQGVFLAIVPAR